MGSTEEKVNSEKYKCTDLYRVSGLNAQVGGMLRRNREYGVGLGDWENIKAQKGNLSH